MHNSYLGKGSSKATSMNPEILYKKSNLVLDKTTNQIMLQSLAWDGVEAEPNADAKCVSHNLHFKSPSRFCSCGFYAYKSYVDAYIHNQGGKFILQVVASGKMFEYDKGFRYGHQRVEKVIVGLCDSCYRYADRLVIKNANGFILPACSIHSGTTSTTQTLLSFSEGEELINKSLPTHAPAIIIRSENKKIVPWVRDKKPSLIQRINTPSGRQSIRDGVLFGATIVTAVIVGGSIRDAYSKGPVR